MLTATKSYIKHPRRKVTAQASPPAAKSYIKFPSPIAPFAVSSWRVADPCAGRKKAGPEKGTS